MTAGTGLFYRLELPRWDTDWRLKTDRRGRLVLDSRTGKPRRHRPVWDTLRGNSRPAHWSARHSAVQEVITVVVVAAKRAGMRPCEHLTVQLVWAPGTNRIADPGNLAGLQKVCCDALARGPRTDLPGLRLVPDDHDRWVEELMPRIDRPPVPAGLWLEVQQR